MNRFTEALRRASRVLEIATDKSFLQWQPMLAVILIATLTHAVSSFDLGTAALDVRTPLAAAATTPTFLLVVMAHRLGIADHRLKTSAVLIAYALGGVARGELLRMGIESLDLGVDELSRWRIPASIVIMTVIDIAVGFTWTTVQRAQRAIANLKHEEQALTQAITQLGLGTASEGSEFTSHLGERLTNELRQIMLIANEDQQQRLELLVKDVVRPLSVDFAKDIKRWAPEPVPAFRVTPLEVWRSIDPARHLPGPMVAVLGMLLPGIASLLTFFDRDTAIRLALATLISLLLSLAVGYRIARRHLIGLKPPWRDVATTATLMGLATPVALGTAVGLAHTPTPTAYVIPVFFAVMVYGWLIMVGNSALDLAQNVRSEVSHTRADLHWSSARINLLDWYHRGVASRLLHGPVQNSIQVGVLRMRAADDVDHASIVSEVVERINKAVADVLDGPGNARASLAVLDELVSTWRGVADIQLHKSEQFEESITQDAAAATIVVDAAAEACSNAIRHGKAKRLVITCDADERALKLEIEDDGSAYDITDKPTGLGAKFMEACSVYSARVRLSDGNLLRLHIPWGESAATE